MTNTDVKIVRWKDTEIPVLVSFYALARLQEQYEMPLDELTSLIFTKKIILLADLLFYAAEAGCFEKGIEVPITQAQAPFVLNSVWTDFTAIVMSALIGESQAPEKEEVKKKASRLKN